MSNSLYASLFSLLFAIKHLSKKVCLFVYLSVNLFDDPFDHPSVGLPKSSFSHFVTLCNSFVKGFFNFVSLICCPYHTSPILSFHTFKKRDLDFIGQEPLVY